MQAVLTKHTKDIGKMSDPEFMKWVAEIDADMKENPDRKGPVEYIVDDTIKAGEAVGNKVNEIVDAYRGYRDAAAEAERAEAQANKMAERVAAKRVELGK